ncbi:MAG TPA: hydrogenase iron-sulfur subunit [Candidatus Goldiibacteriota bacterium]|nr:hydrogenase iron-sulfur subunit [Candidatus Goldiibacteriota bacterium]
MEKTPDIQAKVKNKILLVTMARSSYLAADALGQLHLEYPADVYIIKTLYPGILPSYFYLDSLDKGIDGIIIAAAGADCPVEESYKQLAENVRIAHAKMTEKKQNVKRLRLTAICSVCTNALLKEINMMSEFITAEKREGRL